MWLTSAKPFQLLAKSASGGYGPPMEEINLFSITLEKLIQKVFYCVAAHLQGGDLGNILILVCYMKERYMLDKK